MSENGVSREKGRGDRAACRGSVANYKNWNSLLHLQWYKRADDSWSPLDKADAAAVESFGVFVIWRNGDSRAVSAVLYVGHGFLRNELARCRRAQLFQPSPGLLVTWAPVEDVRLVDGIAAYLYQQLRPMWGEVFSAAQPIPVNLPIAA